ncbi:TadA family conjugal transfer-associated ATPase [Microbacterium sp. 10M-3C3]|jgi:pilus assembly protein CpaF|uniref:TadA family conjugal transfer-associated ATPase n=1 Tax=Microbacterium sp. 10M-3C3 TaxID=2483401 RepID=UPI000F631060|nr:TadA family conjugal transfer-associated ATPase [Microbacterium sp. 10M-3C3]
MSEAFVVVPRRPAAIAVAAARPEPATSATLDDVLAPFARYLADDRVTDLFVNGADGLFVDRGAGTERVREWRAGEADVRALAVALIGAGGRHLDDATPCVDVRLQGGVRVHAVLPPIALAGTTLSVRVPRVLAPDLDTLAARGLTDAAGANALRRLVADRVNFLITGAAGSGKTTLLAALLSEAAPTERIVTIEDVAELHPRHPHHVALEARQPNLEGAGGVDLARLVREALRMRPDRLVVGECRGAEVRELLGALNTGHDGGAGTLHAGGLDDVPARLEALGALVGWDDLALARQAVSAFGAIVHLARGADGVRRLVGMGTPVLDSRGRLAVRHAGTGAA